MRGKGIFITGTDTGVGKTYIAAGIAATLRETGVNVGVMKPAETGCRAKNGRLIPGDAFKLIQSSGVRDALDFVNPYRFRKPLAPSVAARLEGKIIVPAKIISAYRELSRSHDFMIVEGAGGIMVPLGDRYTYLDLARTMKLPVLIIARPGLGTINHTLLTVAALNRTGVDIAGIVINHGQDRSSGLAERTNPSEIEKLSGVPILGVVRHRSRRFSDILGRLSDKEVP